jgi:hypothetical protein
MTFQGLLLMMLAGILLLPLIVGLLEHMLPLIHNRLGIAVPATAHFARQALRQAGALLTETEHSTLSPTQAVAQVAGSFVVVATGVVFFLSDLQLTLATLGPLFGVEVEGALFGSFDQLLGTSVILLALLFGLIVTDLLGWTFTTRFAFIERGRAGAFCMAVFSFIATVAVGVALAYYRAKAMTMDDSALLMDASSLWVQSLPMVILLALAVLLVLGVAVAFMSLDTFFAALVALTVVIGGVLCGIVSLALGVVDLVVEVCLAAVTMLGEKTAPLTTTMQDGVRGMMSGIGRGFGALGLRLQHLVRRVPRGASAVPKMEGAISLERVS